MVPIIILISSLILIVVLTIFSLGVDLVDKGCLVWHRESLGHLLQALICLVCLLVTAINLMHYIDKIERRQDCALFNKECQVALAEDINVMECFVPLLIFSGLWLLKLLCFKVKHSIMHLAITLSIASCAFAFESHFDTDIESAPLFIVAIPVSCILLAISFQRLLEVYFEPDESMEIFYCYDSNIKRAIAIFNAVVTIIYVVSIILALYYLEQKYTNNEEDKIIVHWALFSTLVYAVLMMEQAGSLTLNIIFNQFSIEMINQQMVSKRANLRVLKKQYMVKMQMQENNTLNSLNSRER